MELLKRKQETTQFRSRAEEALRNKQFELARQCIEQGLVLDSGNEGLLSLRSAVSRAEDQAAKCKESLDRAERAQKTGDLDQARQAVELAISIQPDDERAKALAAGIASEIRQRAQKQQSQLETKTFALAVNAVEKAMADARMLAFLGETNEALQALDKVSREASLVPPDLRVAMARTQEPSTD